MGSTNSSRMEDSNDIYSRTNSEEDSDADSDYTVSRLVAGDDMDFYGRKVPKIKVQPNTTLLNNSEFAQSTRMAAGLGPQKRKFHPAKNISKVLGNRERGIGPYHCFSYAKRNNLSNKYLPNTMTKLDTYAGKVFCGKYSKDGKYLITASQDRHIRLYNSETENYQLFNDLVARDVGWSIIDVAFSPDQSQFVYSTWSSSLHLCSVTEKNKQEPLSLIDSNRRFCVFSVVFSSCGRELLGGANDGYLYIYNLDRQSRTLKIPAHEYDVNSVAFADSSSHIIYSGGDDGVVRVWDRRTLDDGESSTSSPPKPVGILAGHFDGITHIDSRQDGRHLVSNSKDQTIKLWDVRVFSGDGAAERSRMAAHDQTWDYRWQQVPRALFCNTKKIEGDTSIMTYRGHFVIKTLVRCRFSPIETTGQRYIYTGSGTGGFVIYDSLSGDIEEGNGHRACVRDVDWHPTRNEIVTSSWDGVVGQWTYTDKGVPESLEHAIKPKKPVKRRQIRD